LSNLVLQHYAEPPQGIPPVVLLPEVPDEASLLEEWLALQRESLGDGAGGAVHIRVPQRGDKRALQETVTRNAGEEFTRHRMRRAADHNSRARALNSLQDALGLPDAPLRIECFDMSHIQGTDYVGSMVVMEDGLPKKSDYRRFKVKTVPGNDDYAAMEEVLTRRLMSYLEDRKKPVEDRTGRFRYPPQLLLVDGGKGQLSVAERVVEELGLEDEIPVASLAKQFEEVYVPGRADPIRIPRQSDALYLLQRIRDEAHRFAITYHRQLRGKRMTKSVLDDISGLGPTRRKRLVSELGGVTAVKAASLETLLALWAGPCTRRSTGHQVQTQTPPTRNDSSPFSLVGRLVTRNPTRSAVIVQGTDSRSSTTGAAPRAGLMPASITAVPDRGGLAGSPVRVRLPFVPSIAIGVGCC